MLINPAPLDEIAAQLGSGSLELETAVEAALDRLAEVDAQVRAFLPEADRRERLLREAKALKAAYPDPGSRPPLYGVLVGVKDIFRADGFETRAGSRVPPERLAGEEAWVVSRLKANGALILGKTVTAEFAYIDPGVTRNPHHLDHTPGGSSSGSAAAVAAGLVPLALGTQTIGSVIRPASYCGVVGFKPSFGRISTRGVIPVSAALDHVGLFTQNAAGMRLAAAASIEDWRGVSPTHARKPRLGVVTGAYHEQAAAEIRDVLDVRIGALASMGYAVQRVNPFEDIGAVNRAAQQLMAYQAAQVHAELFAVYGQDYGPKITELIRQGQATSEAEAAAARGMQQVERERFTTLMHEAGIDVLISPAATGPAPEGLGSTGNSIMNLPWTFTGVPTITLPMDKTGAGLPLGMQITAIYGADEQLIDWALTLEAAMADIG